jgi:hypothetical protein
MPLNCCLSRPATSQIESLRASTGDRSGKAREEKIRIFAPGLADKTRRAFYLICCIVFPWSRAADGTVFNTI